MQRTMPAAVAVAPQVVECHEVPVPEPAFGRVLVRMELASICGSDLHIVNDGWVVDGWPLEPGRPGHEGVGRVVDGGGTGFSEGELVLTAPNIWESRNFAGYQLISPRYLVRLPDGVPPEHLLMAQQLGTVIFAAAKLPSLNGETAVVIGQGSAGLFHDFWLRRVGAGRIIAVEPIRERQEAGLALGVDAVIDVTGRQAVEAVLDLTNGKGADLVVEAVGSAGTLDDAIHMARKLGHIHLFGTPPGAATITFDLNAFFLKCLDLRTTFGAQDEPGLPSFAQAVQLIAEGAIDMAPYTTHRLPIERVADAFALATEPRDGALKVSVALS